MSDKGVVYCATTHDLYFEATLIGAMALREWEPEIPITIISDRVPSGILPLGKYGIALLPLDPEVSEEGNAFSSRYVKTLLNFFSPYRETIFLDADILPVRSFGDIWKYLAEGDIAMAADRLPTVGSCDHVEPREKRYTLRYLPGDTPQFNSGVIVWRDTAATRELFQRWHKEWKVFQRHDQLALARAIHATEVAVVELPRTYNISPRDAGEARVHLLHCWGGMVLSGDFRRLAREIYPRVVESVDELLRDSGLLFGSRETLPRFSPCRGALPNFSSEYLARRSSREPG